MTNDPRRFAAVLAAALAGSAVPARPAAAQVDPERATLYFAEAAALCERDGGRLWGVSLCGPMALADAATATLATNRPAPGAPRPPALGYANAAMAWGGERWSTFVWRIVPADAHARGRLFLHELFHRVQPQLGLVLPALPGENEHLESPDARVLVRLEWRALERALGAGAPARREAVRDALAFRAARRAAFPGAAETERGAEITEGLAQYTGTVLSSGSRAEAVDDVRRQLAEAPLQESFVRTFAYPTGAAYGLLLDEAAPEWRCALTAVDDLGALLAKAARLVPSTSLEEAERRHGGAEVRADEERRDAARRARVAELRHRFVDGPVLVLPRGKNATFANAGVTPVPGSGTVYPQYRVAAEWGSVEATQLLVAADGRTLRVPAPGGPDALTGDGWKVTLAPGWRVRPGGRAGDLELVQEKE